VRRSAAARGAQDVSLLRLVNAVNCAAASTRDNLRANPAVQSVSRSPCGRLPPANRGGTVADAQRTLAANPMMIRAPAIARAAPIMSVRVGACPSISQSHTSDAAI